MTEQQLQMNDLSQRYKELQQRNRDLDEDPAIGFQAEHNMIRLEKRAAHGAVKNCETCGEEISPERLKACPETLWCLECVEDYEVMKGKPWIKDKRFGRRL